MEAGVVVRDWQAYRVLGIKLARLLFLVIFLRAFLRKVAEKRSHGNFVLQVGLRRLPMCRIKARLFLEVGRRRDTRGYLFEVWWDVAGKTSRIQYHIQVWVIVPTTSPSPPPPPPPATRTARQASIW